MILLMTACRSRKVASSLNEVSAYSYSDSVYSDTESTSVSTNTETIKVNMLSEESGERVKFLDKGGEIRFLPDGVVAMTGVAVYECSDKVSRHKVSKETSQNDSTQLLRSCVEALRESSSVSSMKSETATDKPSMKRTALWLIVTFIIVISLKTLWRRLKN